MNLLPYPKKIKINDGVFNLSGISFCLINQIDYRIVKAVVKLRAKLSSFTGTYHKLINSIYNKCGCININLNSDLNKEEYTLIINDDGIYINGGDSAACYYALKTLSCLIDEYKNNLPFVEIEDSPDMKFRGFFHDASRGRVPSKKGLEKIVDKLSDCKINSFSLYIEHTFEFEEFKNEKRDESEYLTADDLLYIDSYCYDHFIDFVPSLSTFGHLYELLSLKKYEHLMELENYIPNDHFWKERMCHHTINPRENESEKLIFSLIDQYLPLFRSQYFNICCDETFDLGKGKNAGSNSAILYSEFVKKIIDHVKSSGKTIMMWADIILLHYDEIKDLPQDVVFLNWDYSKNPSKRRVELLKDRNLKQIVCPGTSSWAALIEKVDVASSNIFNLASAGYEYNVIGLLITNWGDYGHPAFFECSLYGMLEGACISWNKKTIFNEKFEKIASAFLWKTEKNLVKAIRILNEAENTASWQMIFEWQKSKNLSTFDFNEIQLKISIKKCNEVINYFKQLNNSDELKYLICAAEGIKLLNIGMLEVFGKKDKEKWSNYVEKWFKNYAKLWLNDNKKSELFEIKKFLLNIV